MNRLLKFSIWSLGVVALTGLYFSDNIRGHYRFKDICRKDAGLRVYEPLRKEATAGYLLHFYEGISYVRYPDRNGDFRDLIRTAEKKDSSDDGFRSQPIDSNKKPSYEYRTEVKTLVEEARMNRYLSTVTDSQSGKLAVIYQDFTYRLFNPDWGTGAGTACSLLGRDDSDKGPNRSQEIAIQKAFTK
jgi:hypothetical protein